MSSFFLSHSIDNFMGESNSDFKILQILIKMEEKYEEQKCNAMFH